MKVRYFPLLAIGIALFAWNCVEDSASPSAAPSSGSSSTAQSPYYVGGFLIDPETGTVSVAGGDGTVVGQLNADGTVTNVIDGSIFLTADTTLLPSYTVNGLLINKNGAITDVSGNLFGTLNADGLTITCPDGSVIDFNGNIISPAPISSSEAVIINSSAAIADTTTTITSSTSVITSSSSIGTNPTLSSSSAASVASSSSTTTVGDVTLNGNLNQTVAKGSAISTIVFSGVTAEPTRSWNFYFLDCKFDQAAGTYTISGAVPEYFAEGTSKDQYTINGNVFTLTLNIGSASTTVSSSSQAKSSSSVVSSSSQAKSSSSVTSSSSSVKSSSSAASSSSANTGTSEEIKYVAGGASGSGWATRYWDCCKPSCSWTSNAGSGNEARMCTASGSTISDLEAVSTCQGGVAGTCTSQIPIVVNDNLAYAFAAVPASNGGACGKCFALEFDGTGKYESKAPQQALKGKTLIVMASNVGTDVSQGQFDIMIPGGGVGIYNGCSAMGWGAQGNQYGGLLSDCEDAVGYSKTGSALTAARKACLVSSCNSVFANDAQAKAGCLFLANWMNAAGNPNHTYREVECPSALKALY